jgi:hypothetical protein
MESMKDILLTIVAILAIFVGLPLFILWVRDRVTAPGRKKRAEESRRFRQRLREPDLDAVARHFKCTLPESLTDLYGNPEELSRDFFKVARSIDAPEDGWWHVAFYLPADSESCKTIWPGTETYFSFASDVFGDEYLVDPTQADPPVKYYWHESGEIDHVCDSLSEFMTWPRVDDA